MTIPFLVMVISLLVWFVFAKVPQIADPWLADVGKVLFFVSSLVVLLAVTGKPVF